MSMLRHFWISIIIKPKLICNVPGTDYIMTTVFHEYLQSATSFVEERKNLQSKSCSCKT